MTRVLIVDDNFALAEDLAEILEDEGCTCQVSQDPREIASRASELHFDVALVDVRMPGLDGVALHSVLQGFHPDATFLLMTAHSSDDRVAEALAAGVSEVLPKPVPLGRLLGCLPGKKGRILLVEDDEDLASGLKEFLEQEGFVCTVAHNLAEAVLVEASSLDAAIIDYKLPDGFGLDLGQKLVEKHGIPVVSITGMSENEELLEAQGDRVQLLQKPFAMGALLAAVQKAQEVTQ